MPSLRRYQPSPAVLIALVALFVALGGTAVAAVTLAKNSVRSVHIKNGEVKRADLGKNAVDSSKIRDGSVADADLAPGISGAKITGPVPVAATVGGVGADSLRVRWAHVAADGTIVAQSGGITIGLVVGFGEYYVNFGAPTTGHGVVVTGIGNAVQASAFKCGGPPEGLGCPNQLPNTHVGVLTKTSTGVAGDQPFTIALLP